MAIDSTGAIIENSLFASYIVKYDKNGNFLWKTGSTSGDYGRVVVDSANNIYTDGIGGVFSNGEEYLTLSLEKISSGGAILWSSNYVIAFDNEDASAVPMAIGNNGSMYVAIRAVSPFRSRLPSSGSFALIPALARFKKWSPPPGMTGCSYAMANSELTLDSNNNVFYGGPEGILSYSADLSTLRWSNFSNTFYGFPYSVRAIACDLGEQCI